MTTHLLKENRLKQSDIDTACLALIERGERISTTNVHKEVGERGSYSTIQKFITDFRTRNPEQSEQVANLPLKTEIPDSLKILSENGLKAIWQQARELAYSELEVQRESLKKAEDEVNLKITELQEFSDNQANTIEVLREQLTELDNKAKASEDKVRSLDTQVTKLQTALDVQDNQIKEVKAERLQALSAEKVAIEKAAALSGQLEQALKELKQLQGKDKEQGTKLPTPRKKAVSKQVSEVVPS